MNSKKAQEKDLQTNHQVDFFSGKRKKAQMEMSFGMIFTIILIVAFLGFTFFAITKFLNYRDKLQIAQFGTGLQDNVNTLWRSSEGSQNYEYNLPGKVQAICIWNYHAQPSAGMTEVKNDIERDYTGEENTFFYPHESSGNLEALTIKNLDVEKTTKTENPYCLKNKNGKVSLVIIKESISDTKVKIQRV